MTNTTFKILVLLLIFTSASAIFAQSNIEAYIKQGIEQHDNGEINNAIKTYKKALEINKNSPLANYEISLSYFQLKEYKSAIKFADNVLKQNDKYVLEASLIKGSSLDMLGKTKKSIRLFEETLKSTGGNFLLYYNLALNYFKLDDLGKAELNAIKAIEENAFHPSSHMMLANIHSLKGNHVQTVLASHYFLLLEPHTARSIGAFEVLMNSFGGNVAKDDDKPNQINISVSSSEFGAAELMLSMMAAKNMTEEDSEKSQDDAFFDDTTYFFNSLSALRKQDSSGIWWEFYVEFFADLVKSEHMETYCKLITQRVNEKSNDWVMDNEKDIKAFIHWMDSH